MITPKTQTAIAVLKCIYARDYGTCIKQCTLTEGQMRVLLTQLTNAGLIILKEKEHPLEIQSYIPAKKTMEISLLDILEATGEHLNCNSPITERFYAQYGRAAQKLGIVNQITRIYLEGDYTDRFITGTKKLRSRKYIPMLMLLALLSCAGKAGAQTVAVKSDLLTGGMLASPNLGVELKLSERFTLEAGVHYNPFPAGGDRRWKHWFVQPELRYWMCPPPGGILWGGPD